jgi:RNA polymerase sigma-70 factor (ECF subfamily)
VPDIEAIVAMGPEERRQRFEQHVHVVYEPLQRYLHRRADASVVDDVLSDTLLVLWRRLDDVPTGSDTTTVLAWSYGVARRCLANSRRSAHRHDRLVDKVAHDPSTALAAIDERPGGHAGGEAGERLDAALARLSDADRELVHLWAWEGLEPREIAVVLDSTPNAISIRLHRLRRRLADEMTAVTTGSRKDPAPSGHEQGTRHGEEER